jgi:hypothetical protein
MPTSLFGNVALSPSSEWMQRHAMIGDRILFVFDSDVVPFRTRVPSTHWLKNEEDLIFHDRALNTEVMAGNNYAVRNSCHSSLLDVVG